MPRIPEGFRRIERLSPFNALVGLLYERRQGDAVSIGLAIEEKHTNSRGICHGGSPRSPTWRWAMRCSRNRATREAS